MSALAARLAAIVGHAPQRLQPLTGGCIAEVSRADFADRPPVVVKRAPEGGLTCEAYMLRTLASHGIPTPELVQAEDDLLIMAFVPGDGRLTAPAQADLARLVAHMHRITAPTFGLARDTVIGPLPQPNPPGDRWIGFYRDHRLQYMAAEAQRSGRLPTRHRHRIDRLAARLDRWLEEPDRPALLHGDLWGGNIIARNDRIAALIDPAIYFGHPEIELAFGTLFGTLDQTFFDHYRDQAGIAPGFFEARRDLYLLYPLLVHVRLFGGGYVADVTRILDRFGV